MIIFESLVKEEIKPKFKVGDKITNGEVTLTILTLSSDSYVVEDTFGECGTLYFKFMDNWKLVEEKTLIERVDDKGLPFNEWLSHKGAFHVPDGYELKDENGNIINATKIVLEKKKKEYPKTYEECCKVFGLNHYLGLSWNSYDEYSGVITCLPKRIDDIAKKLETLSKLLICRDAYWKIAGEEMGLGKPWEPDWTNQELLKYCIANVGGQIKTSARYIVNTILAFPTEEMRDAFYENFKSEIESCKELL